MDTVLHIGSEAPREPSFLSALPPVLSAFAGLAYNYWWSWQPGGPELFRAIDPERWEACNQNPVRLLVESSCLEQAAANPKLVARADAMHKALAAGMARTFAIVPPATADPPGAVTCAEFLL